MCLKPRCLDMANEADGAQLGNDETMREKNHTGEKMETKNNKRIVGGR